MRSYISEVARLSPPVDRVGSTKRDERLHPPSPRFVLRGATAEAHQRLDSMFSRFDLTHRQGYRDFLSAQAGAFLVVEAALDQAGVSRILRDWKERQRSAALSQDLRAMSLRPEAVASPTFTTDAEILGGAYVLEGARLGAAMLVRSVPLDLPTAFLRHGNPAAWRAFVSVLDDRLSSPVDLEQAVGAATSVFRAFEISADRVLGAHYS